MKSYFATLARYNRWANGRVYEAASDLSREDYSRDCGAFFGSVHRTLNHLIVGDSIWMRRFTSEGPDFSNKLDAVPHDDFGPMSEARSALDERIIGFVDGLDDQRIGASLTYRNTLGHEFTDPLGLLLGHFFNHQTHHRGQVHALLTRLAGEAPPLDLIYYMRSV
jgi:uncharacterized damage-inducible protein DinB